MSRLATWVVLIAAAVGLVASCGFGLADDTGKPIPGKYWKWACPDGGAPAPDAGCATDAASTMEVREELESAKSTGKMP